MIDHSLLSTLIPKLVAFRHDLHAHPELRYEEFRTSKKIAHYLRALGLEVHEGIGKTGVVATLKRGNSHQALMLRADMDALPIQETNSFPHCSKISGVMHACGHDGHTAMLLGAATYLSKSPCFDNGTIYFVFQPAEEGGAGAQAMIEDGLFHRFPTDFIFGIHNWPGLAEGEIAITSGPVMASSNEFRIDIHGQSCHAAMPDEGQDPIYVLGLLIAGLQGLVTRNFGGKERIAFSITQVGGGTISNQVPAHAWLAGTVRLFSNEALDKFEQRFNEICSHIAKSYQCEVEIAFKRNYPAVINHLKATELAYLAAQNAKENLYGITKISAFTGTMGAEDFSFYLNHIPGCYLFLGNGDGSHRQTGHGLGPCHLHNDSYDFNDHLLPIGITYWVSLCNTVLTE
jgi:amidohydrolase